MKVPSGLLLNLQLIHEKMKERGISGRLVIRNVENCLMGVQFFTGQSDLSKSYLYFMDSRTLEDHSFSLENGSIIIQGQFEESRISSTCSYILISGNTNFIGVFNEVQQIFMSYQLMEKKLNQILNHDGTLDDICVAAQEYFGNPVYVHDEHFNILSCPQFVEGITDFIQNEKTGQYIETSETVNNFRTSQAYKRTLNTRGGHFWRNEYTNTRCIYSNIWVNGNYRGRLLIFEIDRSMNESQLFDASYFAEILALALQRRNAAEQEHYHPFDKLIRAMANGLEVNYLEVNRELKALSWEASDQYLCGILICQDDEVTKLSMYSICTDMEERIPECYVCYCAGKVYLLLNMTKSRISLQDLRMKMSCIIREGMFRMGVSFPLRNVYSFPLYFKQAEIVVRYNNCETVPKWFNEFGDYVLKYWMMEGLGELTLSAIVPPALWKLLDYDKQHGTELFHTLETYLTNERNNTLTAQLLKINRSTLPYRIEKIIGLTGINLDQPSVRLYILMGFFTLNHHDFEQ